MRLSRRSTSSAPVTTRRTRRTLRPLRGERGVAPVGRRVGEVDAGGPSCPRRGSASSQASSMVKASTARARWSGGGRARRAPCARRGGGGVGARRSRARPCGCRSRTPRGRRWQKSKSAWKTPLEVVGGVARRGPRGRARPGGAAPSARARASSAGVDALGLVEAVEGAEQVAQRVAQLAVAVGGALQDLRADAQVVGVVRLRHPEAQDVGAVLLRSRPAGRRCCPSDFDIFLPFSSSVKPWVSTRVDRARGRGCRRPPAARTGTSRGAGRSLRDRGRSRPDAVRRGRAARRRGWSRSRTRRRGCRRPCS